jgi:hypothetical protein
VGLPPQNTNYSARYILTKKTLLFMKVKNITKITFQDFSSVYLKVKLKRTAKKDFMPSLKCKASQ